MLAPPLKFENVNIFKVHNIHYLRGMYLFGHLSILNNISFLQIVVKMDAPFQGVAKSGPTPSSFCPNLCTTPCHHSPSPAVMIYEQSLLSL